MTIFRGGKWVVFTFLLCWGTSASGAEYRIDPGQSEVVVQVFKQGLAAALAHDHAIKAGKFSGVVHFDPAAPAGASIELEVDARSLSPDETAMRKKYGLPGEVSEGDRKDIEENMKSEDQLNVAQYPTITFKSSRVKKTSESQYEVTGDLTLRGKTNRFTFPATVSMEGGHFHAKAELKFNQSQFGYEPFSALFGALANKDGVILHLDIVATP